MTTTLPACYEWLLFEDGPRHLAQALKRYGTKEIPGVASSDTILDWALELAQETRCQVSLYKTDDTPWCGLYVAICLHRAGRDELPLNPLWALNWSNYGVGIDKKKAELGDILVFTRKTATGTAGHVGFYIGEDTEHFYVLGGNQSNEVRIDKLAKARLWAVRRPPYVLKPANVRKVYMRGTAAVLSTNEA